MIFRSLELYNHHHNPVLQYCYHPKMSCAYFPLISAHSHSSQPLSVSYGFGKAASPSQQGMTSRKKSPKRKKVYVALPPVSSAFCPRFMSTITVTHLRVAELG